jgi:hypothetical protein
MVVSTHIKTTASLQDPIEINYVSPDLLMLDTENPRFAGLTEEISDDQLLTKLRKEMHLDELIDSFRENCFYNTEPLLVVESPQETGKFIVVEGNRRLAAIKLLLTPNFKVDKKIKDQLAKRIPVAVYPNRKSLWSYLGFRHINGPKEWDSYSKAVYAYSVHKKYKIALEEIANRIGDAHLTVIRMCNGLMVLEQAESEGFFSSKDVDLRKFYFSHLYTILQKDNTKKFLGIRSTKKDIFKKNPVPASKLKNLQRLLELLFGNQAGTIHSVIRSQNPDLKRLDEVLGNKTAYNYLKENSQEQNSLDNALSFIGTEDHVVDELLNKALNALRKANGFLYKFKGGKEATQQIKEIHLIATEMLGKTENKKRKE